MDSDLIHYIFGTNMFSEYTSTCVNKKNMGCYFYNSKEDCEGTSGSASFDVFYDSEFGPYQRPLFGTNAQITFSDDVFGFGDCVWNDDVNICYSCMIIYFFISF